MGFGIVFILFTSNKNGFYAIYVDINYPFKYVKDTHFLKQF